MNNPGDLSDFLEIRIRSILDASSLRRPSRQRWGSQNQARGQACVYGQGVALPHMGTELTKSCAILDFINIETTHWMP